ncbi:hypothetical protein N7470_002627 [Penicillium chermesinum]|nr:hypothetical protein N7470_002627 [Penicillium chermesinum]
MIFYRRNKDDLHHPITSEDLVFLLKTQLDENINRYTSIRSYRTYGVLFKLTCVVYSYTIIGSAIPVFLDIIDLTKIYFLYKTREICYILVIAWGEVNTVSIEPTSKLLQNI